MRLTGHKDLDVWKKSMALVLDVYKNTQNFPSHELYGLTSQIRRSALSIPSNIAEGAARRNKKEFIQFLYIALGSASELHTQLIIGKNLNYFQNETKVEDQLTRIQKMLYGLIKYMEKS
jgi:four helix bundle protein